MARDYIDYVDPAPATPEEVAREVAVGDVALEDALRARPPEAFARYAHAYDAARKDIRRAARRDRLWARLRWLAPSRRAPSPAPTCARRPAAGLAPPRPAAPASTWRAARSAAQVAALVLVVAGLAATGYAATRWPDVARAVAIAEAQMRCAEVTVMEDDRGDILAYVPIVDADTCARERAELAMGFDDPARLPDRPGLTVPLDPATEAAVVEALVVIEGEIGPFPGTVLAHDWRGPLRFLASKAGILSGERGFSAPVLTTFESLIGHPGAMAPADKIVTILATSLFAARHLPDEASRAAFVARNLPAVRGRGYPLGGRLATDALFGGPPETLAQTCILARAMGVPLLLPRTIEDVGTRAGRSWATILGPATRRCVQVLGTSEAEILEGFAELRALCGDSEVCMRPGSIPDEAARDDAFVAIARAHLPIDAPRAQSSREARRALLDGLRLAGDWTPGETVSTTLSREAQGTLDAAMPLLLDDLQDDLPPGLCFGERCPELVLHDVAAVEIAPGGPVLRAVHSATHGAFFGPVRAGEDGYVALPPDMGLGSIKKSIMALVAARHGYDLLCLDPSAGVECARGGSVSVEEAMARSLNDPFAWLAERHPAEVEAVLDALGAAPSARIGTGFSLALDTRRHLPTARYAALYAALEMGGAGAFVRAGATAPETLDLGALGYDASAIARAKEILAAPVSHPHGTLRETARRAAVPGCVVVAGKSGTHAVGKINIVKASLLVWRCDIDGQVRRFVTSVTLSTGDPAVSLGERRHAELAPFHRAALEAALAPND